MKLSASLDIRIIGSTFYVDATGGNDTNSGLSPASAWRTIARINTAILKPGDSVLLKRGETWLETLTLPANGQAGRPITLDAYGSGALPLLKGSDVVTGWTLDSGSIYKVANSYNASPRFQLFEDGVRLTLVTSKANVNSAGKFYLDRMAHILYVWCSDSASPATHVMKFSFRDFGVLANGMAWWNIRNIHTLEFCQSGFNFRDAAGANNITVNGCTSEWNTIRGFDLGVGATEGSILKHDIAVVSCIANDNIAEGFWSGHGYNLGFSHCIAFNNGKDWIKGYAPLFGLAGAGITLGHTSVDSYVRNCIVHDNYGGNSQVDVEYEVAGDYPLRSIVECNLIYTGVGPVNSLLADEGHGTIIRNNVLYGTPDTPQGIWVWSGADGSVVYHNTIHLPGNAKNIFRVAGKNCISKNNIIYGTGTNTRIYFVEAGAIATLVSDYNEGYGVAVYWVWNGNFYSLTNWRTNTSQDTHSLASNPVFVADGSDYHLQAASPCKDAGATGLGVLTDYDGVVRDATPDIGAYEFH